MDLRHADQQVRGAVALPRGTGKTMHVLVFAKGEKLAEAEAASAEFYGGEELIAKIENENWFDYDLIVATPDMMGVIGRLGRILGPKGLMPNPKSGTDKLTKNFQTLIRAVTKAKHAAAKGTCLKSVNLAIYGKLRAGIGKILRELCQRKDIEIIEAKVCPGHVHMLISIPPKHSVSEIMGYLKGKSSLIIFDRHANLKYKYGNRHFWCRRYYVDTVGKNKNKIAEYIQN